MDTKIAFLLLIPFIVWSSFQGVLYTNYSMTEEALAVAVYEGQKEASLQGHYDEAVYDQIRTFLVESRNFDGSKVQIEGTETPKARGEMLEVEISIPRPATTLWGMFTPFSDSDRMTVKREIMSEYIP